MGKVLPSDSWRRIYIIILILSFSHYTKAQFPFTETFKNSTAPGMVLTGSAFLTSGITDPLGEGYLQLTNNSTNQSGSAHSEAVFNSNQGLSVEFEYFVHDGVPFPPFGVGDGFTFFLFNADSSFRLGAFGGSLGYANKFDPPTLDIPGMNDGYIGIGIDLFGNYASTYEGKNGGAVNPPNLLPSTVSIRGPGDGQGTGYYVYQTGQQTTAPPFNFQISDTTTGRDPLPTGSGYRKVKIEMSPINSGGVVTGYNVTVKVTTGGATSTEHTLINNFTYNFIPPPRLKFGFAASTGLATSYNEVRNISVDVFDPSSLQNPVAINDTATTCSETPVVLSPLSNDFTPNGGGTAPFPPGINFNKTTIDFDTATAGLQQYIAIPGVGEFGTDTSGLVVYAPEPGFIGTARVTYFVTDVYGVRTLNADTIVVNVTTDIAPVLSISTPQPTCSPNTVDITQNSGVWSVVPAGGATNYFTDPAGINVLIDSAAIAQTGIYYVIHTGVNGCRVVKPVEVTITSPAASPVVLNNYNCGAGTVTLEASGAANNENYNWYDAASGGNLLFTGASFTTPVLSTTTNYWVTIYNSYVGGCESNRVQATASINPLPATTDAGPTQNLNIADTIYLNAATPQSGETGLWTLVSGPNVPVILEPTRNNAKVINLNQGIYEFAWTVQATTCSDSDHVIVQVLSVLPVTWVKFEGALSTSSVVLKWATATELNSSFFAVERSTNGVNFQNVGNVPAAGNAGQLTEYTFEDPIGNVNTPVIYYRLKQVDLDGHFEYSKVISVRLNLVNAIVSAWPNPVSDMLHVRVNKRISGPLKLDLFDTNGRLILSQQTSQNNANQEILIHATSLPSGLYILNLWHEGSIISSYKFIKR